MAKPKNQQTLTAISRAAWRLFVKQGYTKTSYDHVAKESGINKPLVQHYFPKKELLIFGGITNLRTVAAHKASRLVGEGNSNSSKRFYVLGQIYIAALTSNNQVKKFLLDILESRSLTSDVIAFDFDWSLSEVSPEQDKLLHRESFLDTNTANMGAFYELLFYKLRNDQPYVLSDLIKPAVLSLMEELGWNPQDAKRELDKQSFTNEQLQELGAEALAESLQ